MSPTHLTPGSLAAGVAPDQAGATIPRPGGPGMVAPGPFGVAAAWRALGAHGRCAPPPGLSQRLCEPRRREYGGTRRVPQESLRTHSIKALSPLSASCGS